MVSVVLIKNIYIVKNGGVRLAAVGAGPVSAVTLTVETGEGSTVLATLLLATTQNKSTQPSARAAPLRLFSMFHHIILLLS